MNQNIESTNDFYVPLFLNKIENLMIYFESSLFSDFSL